jgi:hypothetical protein
LSRFIRAAIPLVVGSLVLASSSYAQLRPDVFIGVGTTVLGSSGQSIDTFSTGSPFSTPRMGGAFGKAGADILITPYFGIGGETDFRFSQASYAGLNYRPVFYDFNGIWLPTAHRLKRIVPELQAGLGGVNLKFYFPQSTCDAFAGCSSSNSFIESSNHLQVHLEGGVRVYLTPHLFLRPQVDAHYVNNFFQFGSNWVPEYGASLGWSFGER